MASYISISSTEELDTLLSKNTFILLDFWASWCPPCRAIAPLFEQLAAKNTSPGGLVFAKVDVDAQKEVSRRYSISAMPTFLLLENGKVIDTVRGARPPAIRDLVKHAKTELAKGKKERGEVVDEREVEDDGVDESVLPSQSGSGTPMATILIFLVVMVLYRWWKSS